MTSILQSAHSGMRWLVIIAFVLFLVSAMKLWLGKNPLDQSIKKVGLLSLITAHLQVIIGIILYFSSPKVQLGDMGAAMKDSMLRFFAVEHLLMMLISVVLITIAYSKVKKLMGTEKGAKVVSILLIIAALLFIVGIPWPPRFDAGWM